MAAERFSSYRLPEEETLKKEKALDSILEKHRNVLIAFSGGVDSTYLLYKAIQVLGKDRVLAVNLQSGLNRSIKPDMLINIAGKLDAELMVEKLDLLSNPLVKNNSRERCYHCKKDIYGELLKTAGVKGIEAVLDGSNADDPGDYRPGMKALKELGIITPLLDAGLSKKEIRELSAHAALPTWNQPATTCLATRFPYGTGLEKELLDRVYNAEKFLQSLLFSGDLRVRCHDDLARIEVSGEEFEKVIENRYKISSRLKALGFTHVTLNLDDFKSGSMNIFLDESDK